MLADSGSLALAIVALRVGRRPANARRTFGHRRYQPLAAFINGQALLLLTVWVVYEAIVRLTNRPEVNGGLMLIIALIGAPLVLSYTIVIHWIFRGKVKLTPSSY